jgi:hypothetical protein
MYVATGALATNLLVKMNGAGLVIVNTATPADLPVGVTYTATDAAFNVPVCGLDFGIQSIMAAAVVININDLLYAGAGGTVTNVAGGRLIGIAKTATAGSTVIDVVPMPLILTAAALAAASAQAYSLAQSLGSAASFTTAYSPALGRIYICLSTFTNGVSDTMNNNFQTLMYACQQLAIDVADIRAKLQTSKVVQ